MGTKTAVIRGTHAYEVGNFEVGCARNTDGVIFAFRLLNFF
jgi:hypothetical protein